VGRAARVRERRFDPKAAAELEAQQAALAEQEQAPVLPPEDEADAQETATEDLPETEAAAAGEAEAAPEPEPEAEAAAEPEPEPEPEAAEPTDEVPGEPAEADPTAK
jgi:hypothetical protein